MSNPAEHDSRFQGRSMSWLQVLCCPDRAGRLEPDWLQAVRAAFPDATRLAPAALASEHGLEPWSGPAWSGDDMAEWRQAIGPGQGLLVLRSGLEWSPGLSDRLQRLREQASVPDVIILPGNYADAVNPLADLPGVGPETDPHSLLAGAGTGMALPVRLPDGALFFLPPDRAIDQTHEIGLIDDLYLHDPTRSKQAGALKQPQGQSAFGPLRARLAGLLAAGVQALPDLLNPSQGLTLHITHSWGGGIARWIADQCREDRHGRHLILSAVGQQDGREHGQFLALYSGSQPDAPLAEWPLAPPISDSSIEHPAYAELLDQIIQRFGVGRLVVSSLIGHSLDALRSDLPTLVMLHDFYPATPLLHEDPLQFLDSGGRPDLAMALSRQRSELLFEHDEADYWLSLRGAWIDAVHRPETRLVAPTRHVADRWLRLCDDRLPEIAIQAHGFSRPADWPEQLELPVPESQRLRLVVVGRLSEGKGLGLLEAALPSLRPWAQVTLLGAGRDAYRLFGRAGVDVVLNYRMEELPDLLATVKPDAALFLSTVPETWNYVLSEMRALGVTPIATRLGSFEERIVEGVDGLLFDPDPADLVDTIQGWRLRRDELRAMGRQASAEPSVSAASKAYRRWVPERISPAAWTPVVDRAAVRAGLLSESLRQVEQRASALAEAVEQQQLELDKRAAWAQRSERLAGEHGDRARSLERQIAQAQVEHEQQMARQIQKSEQAMNRLNLALRGSQAELHQQHARIDALCESLEQAHSTIAAQQAHVGLMSNSLSWRLTRPMRFAARLGRKARVVQLWNPLRWPRLIASTRQILRRHGRRGIMAAISMPRPSTESPGLSVTETVPPSVPSAVALPSVPDPRASVIIPVYNKVELTSACLNSLATATNELAFEVIVVDDCSTDGTAPFLAQCRGLRVIRNDQNAGFIDSCNRGAAEARSPYVVFLNNDTTVNSGWLDALLKPFENDEQVGIVGARLVYPDGRLQEAGGIIFSDASGWNYGKGDSPEAPQYGFVSEADYVSGACLAIRRRDFETVGGFDTRFRPAYYEDTDLCFQVRSMGKQVLVQPACTIVHHEGATSGTDENSGAKRYQAVNRERFQEKWASVLETHPAAEPDNSREDPVRHLRYRRFRKRALVLDATTPQPDHDSGSVRIRAAMDLLLARGYQVTFMAANQQYLAGYTDQLTQAGIEVLYRPGLSDFDAWMAEHGPDLDLILASRHYVLAPLLPMLRHHARRALLVFDTVDLHYLREQREADLLKQDHLYQQAAATREQELRLIAQADVSLVVSPVEQALLAQELPDADVRVLSNIHRVHGPGPDWSERSGLLFVGGFQHVPNVDAVRWLASEIFPRIRAERPEIELHLIGSRMPESILALDEVEGIVVHGFVEDLAPHLSSVRISLAPLRYGAGVKGKVNQAMSHGLPVVATSCAAEGMFLAHERDVLIADDPAQFAAEVIRLHDNEALWNRLVGGGLDNVERHFSRRAADAVLAGLETAEARLASEPGAVRAAGESSGRRVSP